VFCRHLGAVHDANTVLGMQASVVAHDCVGVDSMKAVGNDGAVVDGAVVDGVVMHGVVADGVVVDGVVMHGVVVDDMVMHGADDDDDDT
jgi:hypothetical protein